MEILIEISKYLLISLILLGVMYWNYSVNKKYYKKAQEDRDKTNAYLDTVVRRMEMSTSAYALSLLLDEVYESTYKLKYDQVTFERGLKIKYFLMGKAYGLKKIDDKKLEI